MIGPFSDPRQGAMGVFVTREAAEEFVRVDQFLLEGVVKRWELRRLRAAPRPGPGSPDSASDSRAYAESGEPGPGRGAARSLRSSHLFTTPSRRNWSTRTNSSAASRVTNTPIAP